MNCLKLHLIKRGEQYHSTSTASQYGTAKATQEADNVYKNS